MRALFGEVDEPEPVSDMLVLGLLFFPGLFVWFLFAGRYSREIRIGASVYALFGIVGLASLAWTFLRGS